MVAWYGILKSGTRRRAPASLYEVFFLQRYKDAVTDDDVVKHLDAYLVTCLNKLLGRPYILLTRVVGRPMGDCEASITEFALSSIANLKISRG